MQTNLLWPTLTLAGVIWSVHVLFDTQSRGGTGTFSEEGAREWATRQQQSSCLLPSLPPSSLPEELAGTRHQGSPHSLAELLGGLVTPSQPQLWIMRCSGIWVMCFSWLLFPNVLVQQASKRSELSQTSILPHLQVKSYPPSKPPFLLFCFSFFSLTGMSNERKSMCIRYKVYGGFVFLVVFFYFFFSFHTVLCATVYINKFLKKSCSFSLPSPTYL